MNTGMQESFRIRCRVPIRHKNEVNVRCAMSSLEGEDEVALDNCAKILQLKFLSFIQSKIQSEFIEDLRNEYARSDSTIRRTSRTCCWDGTVRVRSRQVLHA